MRAALGQYELDYWQHCSLESMEAISALGQEGETLRVYGGWKMTDTYAEQLGNIENITERVDGEYQVDYSIVNFKHVVPPDVLWFAEKANSIHRVDVDGVPICMVVKGDSGVRCRFDPTDGSRICWVLPGSGRCMREPLAAGTQRSRHLDEYPDRGPPPGARSFLQERGTPASPSRRHRAPAWPGP
ncbi:MAG: hypothetical protein M5U09_08760 [Gammaproteobacteria bacterium]|nr:hypothetical protein [Gammaproteobacteria bacterium]